MSDSVRPHRQQPTRLPRPWDSPGKNTGVGCHFLLQCMKVESESEVTQSCPTLCDPIDGSPPGSSVHGIFQARVLEWGAIAFSRYKSLVVYKTLGKKMKISIEYLNIILIICSYNIVYIWSLVCTGSIIVVYPEKEMATHCSVLAWRIPGTGEPGGLSSMGSHRVGHD